MTTEASAKLVCCSHSPLMFTNVKTVDPQINAEFFKTMRSIGDDVDNFKPDAVVIFHSDHFLGQFLDNMPAFCISKKASSVKEFSLERNDISIPSDLVMELSHFLIENNFDIAVSHNASVDHGVTVPLQLMFEGFSKHPVIPIFINCFASPRPRFDRAIEIGHAIGEFFLKSKKRVVFVGSGGLSHQSMASVTAKTFPHKLFSENRRNEQQQAEYEEYGVRFAEAMINGAGQKPNEEWDLEFLDAFVNPQKNVLDVLVDSEMETVAGGGSHEVRSWLAAWGAASALGVSSLSTRFYHPIVEWVTGMGIVTGD